MINGFVKKGPLADPTICTIIKPIEQIIKDFKQKDYPIVAICDAHQEDSKEFDAFIPHCLKGSKESMLIDEFKIYEDDMQMIEKNSVNGFLSLQFQEWFVNQPTYKNYIVVGCVTDICVLNLASTLMAYIHQNNLEANVYVSKDTSETFEIENHPRESFNYMAYTLLEQLGVKVIEHVELNNF